MANVHDRNIDIADKTFDLSLEDASESESDNNEEDHHQQQKQSNNKTQGKPFYILDPILTTGNDTEPPIVKSTTLRSPHTSSPPTFTSKSVATINQLKKVKETHISQHQPSLEINTCLHNIITQLTKISGNQANPRYKQEQDSMKLLSFVERLSQSCQFKFDLIHDNYKYTNDLYESCLQENNSLKREINELKELNRYLQRSTTEPVGLITQKNSSNSTPVVIGTETEQIFKLKKEIKEYKRFIKELMDREY